jgi:hypothetical protein
MHEGGVDCLMLPKLGLQVILHAAECPKHHPCIAHCCVDIKSDNVGIVARPRSFAEVDEKDIN